jgi:serine/threonine-protein kinase
VRRYEILTRGDFGFRSMSPDGQTIIAAGPGLDSAGGLRLWTLSAGQLDPTRIEGVSGAQAIFSPDGSELAVFTDEKKVIRTRRDGTSPQVIGDSAQFGGWWGRDGFLYYTHVGFTLARRAVTGGPAELLTTVTKNSNEFHALPQLLPDGKHVLFTAVRTLSNDDTHEIRALDLASRTTKLITRGSSALYGHGQLVFLTTGGILQRAPFDPVRLEITGPAVTIATQVPSVFGLGNIALAEDGTLLYQTGATGLPTGFQRLLTLDLRGTPTPMPLPAAAYNSLRVSPDGSRLAYEVSDGTNDGGTIFTLALGDSVPVRLTFQGLNTYPTWSLDGQRVAFSRLLDGERDLAWQAADGSGSATPLLARPGNQFEVEFIPGDHMVVREGNATGGSESLDLRTFTVGNDSAADFATSPALERAMRVSPDGRWIAYVAEEGGRDEVFVRPFPDPGTGAVWQVTNEGGGEPVWARSGAALFFKSRGALYRADVRTASSFAVGARRRLFSTEGLFNNAWHPRYDVLPGDTAFVTIGAIAQRERPRTILVERWADEVRREARR